MLSRNQREPYPLPINNMEPDRGVLEDQVPFNWRDGTNFGVPLPPFGDKPIWTFTSS